MDKKYKVYAWPNLSSGDTVYVECEDYGILLRIMFQTNSDEEKFPFVMVHEDENDEIQGVEFTLDPTETAMQAFINEYFNPDVIELIWNIN